jgi:hypothetical protein
MATVSQLILSGANNSCSTSTVRGLSLQIIDEMNLLGPNVLVNITDLLVTPTSNSVNSFLQPAAKESLRRAIARRGVSLSINSAYRTVAQQYMLRRWFELGLCGIGAAAQPGFSNHEDGLALDTNDFQAWRSAMEAERWDWLGDTNPRDPFHFTYVGSGVRDDIGEIGVKAFQQLWNKTNPTDIIKVDGDFGDATRKRIDKSPAEGFASKRLLRLIQPPMQGDDVKAVRQALVKLGLLAGASGVYDQETADAVKNFQKSQGLSEDGVVGLNTRRKLGVN